MHPSGCYSTLSKRYTKTETTNPNPKPETMNPNPIPFFEKHLRGAIDTPRAAPRCYERGHPSPTPESIPRAATRLHSPIPLSVPSLALLYISLSISVCLYVSLSLSHTHTHLSVCYSTATSAPHTTRLLPRHPEGCSSTL